MKLGKKAEKKVAKELKGKLTPLSGAGWADKADLELDEYLCEVKSTDKKSFSITEEIWNKITKQAYAVGKQPLLIVKLNGKQFAVCEFETLKYLLENQND